jgi:4-diphosphocytidyl-2-C-methyl-D-erythritol kinase
MMVVFPNCKINLGLYVTHKRPDGYHHLESIFLPVPFTDALEIIPNGTENCQVFTYQSPIEIADEEHSCYQAWSLLRKHHSISGVDIHLIKNIPSGAGLGGGSSDAAFTLMQLNAIFNIGLSQMQLIDYAAQLGSDQAFFIWNQPCYLSGSGPEITPFAFEQDFKIQLSFPNVHISTKEAYAGLVPHEMEFDLRELKQFPKKDWRHFLRNDFQVSAVKRFPVIQKHIDHFYDQGAFYAGMSGSGSAVFGLFD